MHHADVVELVDTLDSGSSAREGMKVQVLSSALKTPVVRYRGFRFWAKRPSLPFRLGYAGQQAALRDTHLADFGEGARASDRTPQELSGFLRAIPIGMTMLSLFTSIDFR